MSDWLTTLPYGWYGLLLTFLAGLLYAANWYLERPLTPADADYSATDIQLGIREGREPTLVGSALDTSDYDEAIDEWCEELFESLVRWLEVRDHEESA